MYRAPEPHSPNTDAAQLPLWDEESAQFAVSLRHSPRARRVAVRINAGGLVELVVPRGVAEHHAWSFLESRSDWVRHHVARRRAAMPPPQEFPPRLLRLPLLGETWRIFQAGGAGRPRLVVTHAPSATPDRRPSAARTEGVLELRGAGTPEEWRRGLLTWLKRRALPALGERLAMQARLHDFSYSAVTVRCQRTRWGSCSARGTITLNLALLFQPEDVVRYLLCHELAHTRHLNHSARFWRCVAACEPRWRALDAALVQGWRHVPAWLVGAS
ncbi:MAG TPA: SprT family zinc-dependent metalloprotease [Steroidobacteraceae bacterium]|nr:SprT family zinc-dependent metalloprotease [Steroidobacteraceae bacterium]